MDTIPLGSGDGLMDQCSTARHPISATDDPDKPAGARSSPEGRNALAKQSAHRPADPEPDSQKSRVTGTAPISDAGAPRRLRSRDARRGAGCGARLRRAVRAVAEGDSEGRRRPRTAARVPRLPVRAPRAPAHNEPDRVHLRDGAAAPARHEGRRVAVGGTGDGLQTARRRAAALAAGERPASRRRRPGGRRLRRWRPTGTSRQPGCERRRTPREVRRLTCPGQRSTTLDDISLPIRQLAWRSGFGLTENHSFLPCARAGHASRPSVLSTAPGSRRVRGPGAVVAAALAAAHAATGRTRTRP